MKRTVDVVPSLQGCRYDSTASRTSRVQGDHEIVDSPGDIVLSNSCARNHDGCWILYLHFTQKHVAVLGELDICRRCKNVGRQGLPFSHCRENGQVPDHIKDSFSSLGGQKTMTEILARHAPPDPPTSIFMVPFGPKFVRITSCSPFAALMFINKAADLPITSAFGLRVLSDDMLPVRLAESEAQGYSKSTTATASVRPSLVWD